jgi:hypothetical protein
MLKSHRTPPERRTAERNRALLQAVVATEPGWVVSPLHVA